MTAHIPRSLERKDDTDPAKLSLEVKTAMDGFLKTFEDFKKKNDERLSQVEKKGSADVVTKEEVDRINKAIDDHKATVDKAIAALKRPSIGDGGEKKQRSPEQIEYSEKFGEFFRKGEEAVGGRFALRDLEKKALSVGSDPDGGFTVRPEMETAIDQTLKEVSPIRSIASVRTIGTSEYKKLVNVHGAASGWVGEQASRPQTAASTLEELSYPVMEIYAMPAATQSLLDDSIVNIDQWLADEVALEFAYQEGVAFVSGNGVMKPRGILSYTTVADASWVWEKLGYVVTGSSGAFPSAATASDPLISLVYALKQGYRQGAGFLMSRSTQAAVRKLKDTTGQSLWQPNLQAGQPATLLGYGITEAEDMPVIAADSYSIAFGNFARGYLIVDRYGVRVLRDPYTAKPYVLFYTTKRVGGGVQNFEAIKLLKFGTS